MKTADEHYEARKSASGQIADPIALAVVTERERLISDPMGKWCAQVLTDDIRAVSFITPLHVGEVSSISLPVQAEQSPATVRLSAIPGKLPSESIPRLDRITVRVTGTFPLIRAPRPEPPSATEEHSFTPRIEPAAVPPPIVKKTPSVAKAIVKVIPAKEKRTRRKPEIEAAPVVAEAPKPLKVIRRRKEEAPNVFETGPRTVPRAMLEGIDSRDMEGNGQ